MSEAENRTLQPVGLTGPREVKGNQSNNADGTEPFFHHRSGPFPEEPLVIFDHGEEVLNADFVEGMELTAVGMRKKSEWRVGFVNEGGESIKADFVAAELRGDTVVKATDGHLYYGRVFKLEGELVIGVLREDQDPPSDVNKWFEEVFIPLQADLLK